jgi:predicted nucleic acid-binding protein
MTELVGLLDTNVILRFIMQDQPAHSEAANQLFERIEQGEIAVQTLDTVVFECVFTLEKRYGVPRPVIVDAMSAILAHPGIKLAAKEKYADVFQLWVTTQRLSFADAFHLVSTKHLGLDTIISFDRGLRGIEGVTRLEPPLG